MDRGSRVKQRGVENETETGKAEQEKGNGSTEGKRCKVENKRETEREEKKNKQIGKRRPGNREARKRKNNEKSVAVQMCVTSHWSPRINQEGCQLTLMFTTGTGSNVGGLKSTLRPRDSARRHRTMFASTSSK